MNHSKTSFDSPKGISSFSRSFLYRIQRIESIDPLLIFLLLIDESRLSLLPIGARILKCISDCIGEEWDGADNPCHRDVFQLVCKEISNIFYGTWLTGHRGVRSMPNAFGSVSNARKKDAIRMFVDRCSLLGLGQDYCCTLQLVYRSGARRHEIFLHPEECIIFCRDTLSMRDRGVLSIIEVPGIVQSTQKFYIDWDMQSDQFPCMLRACVDGILPPVDQYNDMERMMRIRRIALGTPSLVASSMVRLGIIQSIDTLQVVIKEGSRWNRKRCCYKISMHFVFQLIMTRDEFMSAWSLIVDDLSSSCIEFEGMYRSGDPIVVTDAVMESMGPNIPLVGIDLHPFSNQEQGLALPFSFKSCDEITMSRPMSILHLRGGEELMNEVPCRSIWSSGNLFFQNPASYYHKNHPSIMDPNRLLWSILDSSICIPGKSFLMMLSICM